MGGDEIGQVIQLEIQGCKFLIEGSAKVAKMAMTILKWLCGKIEDASGKLKDKIETRPGERAWPELLKLSSPESPQSLVVDEDVIDELREQALKDKLHFNVMNLDSEHPVIFMPPAEMIRFEAIYKQLSEKKLKENLEKIKDYDKDLDSALDELKELDKQLAENPELKNDPEFSAKYDKAKARTEGLDMAKSELEGKNEDYEKVINAKEGELCKPFEQYLQTLAGTEFERDPEKAMTAYSQGIEQPEIFTASECFAIVRDPSSAPKSKITIYMPEIGSEITREFKINKEDGTIYSEYTFINKDGDKVTFSDLDMPKGKWEEVIVPRIYEEAGILADTKVNAFHSKEACERYKAYSSLITDAEKNVEAKIKSGQSVFSSTEAENNVMYSVDQLSKSKFLVSIDKNIVRIEVEPDKLRVVNGVLRYDIGDNKYINITSHNVESQRTADGNIILNMENSENVKIVEIVQEKVDIETASIEKTIGQGNKEPGTFFIASKNNPKEIFQVKRTETDVHIYPLDKDGQIFFDGDGVEWIEFNKDPQQIKDAISEFGFKHGMTEKIVSFQSLDAAKNYIASDGKTTKPVIKEISSMSAGQIAERVNVAKKATQNASQTASEAASKMGR